MNLAWDAVPDAVLYIVAAALYIWPGVEPVWWDVAMVNETAASIVLQVPQPGAVWLVSVDAVDAAGNRSVGE